MRIGLGIHKGNGKGSFVTLPEQGGGTPSYYLSLNGTTSDKLATPALTFDEVVMDFSVTTKDAYDKYWSCNFEFVQWHGAGYENWSAAVQSITKNGVAQTNNTVFITPGERTILRIKTNLFSAKANHLFNNAGSGGFTAGRLYDVKFYNGATLVAHYDMTKGNVQDQSGNNNHGILTGGTWIQT